MVDRQVTERLFEHMVEGGSVLEFCSKPGNPSRATIYRWQAEDEDFARQFARARESGADALVDMAQRVADDGRNDTYEDEDGHRRTDHDVIQRSKLRVDTLLKRAACYQPQRYGSKVAVGGDAAAPPIQVAATGPEIPATSDLLAGIKVLGRLADEVLGGEDSKT